MNAREFLVTTVHEIAISTEFAMPARASEEADTDALTNRPALDARAKGIDPPDHFVTRDARPADWKGGFYRAGIRVADTARLDANTHLTGAGIDERFHYGFEFSRFRYLDCSIHCAPIASLMFRGQSTYDRSRSSPGAWMSAYVTRLARRSFGGLGVAVRVVDGFPQTTDRGDHAVVVAEDSRAGHQHGGASPDG